MAGSSSGTSSLLRLSEGLVECSREERQAMAAMYERETRREKVLGSKEKEGRARKMEVVQQAEEAAQRKRLVELEEREEGMKRAERKFFDMIKQERESRVAELNSLLSVTEKEL